MAVALKLGALSRTSVTHSDTGEPATTALTVTMPGGAAGWVDTPRASSATSSTRQTRGGVSVRSSISTVPPTSANRASVRVGAVPSVSPAGTRSEMLNSPGAVRTRRRAGAARGPVEESPVRARQRARAARSRSQSPDDRAAGDFGQGEQSAHRQRDERDGRDDGQTERAPSAHDDPE